MTQINHHPNAIDLPMEPTITTHNDLDDILELLHNTITKQLHPPENTPITTNPPQTEDDPTFTNPLPMDMEKQLLTPSTLFNIEHSANRYLHHIDTPQLKRQPRNDVQQQWTKLDEATQSKYQALASENIHNHGKDTINLQSPARKPFDKTAAAWHDNLAQQRNIST